MKTLKWRMPPWFLAGAIALSTVNCTVPASPPQLPATQLFASTELIEAAQANDLAQVRQLLAQGADANTVVKTNTALTYAARDGYLAIAQLLIDHGADVNWIDGEGVTPLILSSFKGHVELTQLLLAQDADVTVRDQWNRTALDYALRRGEDDAIAQLLREASPEGEDTGNKTHPKSTD